LGSGILKEEVGMFVKDYMTKDPVTVTPDTPVLDAIRLLKEKGFRRLPVLKNGKLVGLATEKDLKDAMPSKATTLSVWEMNYLLSKLTVEEVMVKNVLTIPAEAPLEEAALLMEEKKIGALPVMEGERLVGIITVTDVMKAFTEVMGLKEGGMRVTVDIPDVPGSLAQMAQAVVPSNIVSVVTAGKEGGYRRIVLRVVGEGAETVADRLRAAGEKVVDVRKG
jgi:acetoin utilization protein AcuB